MAFRFRRTLGIFPGLRLNLGKKSASFSVGIKGLRATMGTRGKRGTVGIPGSGLSYTTTGKTAEAAPSAENTARPRFGRVLVVLIVLGGLLWLMARSPAPPVPSQRPAVTVQPLSPEPPRAQPSVQRPPVAVPAPTRPALPADPWAKARQPN